jgi:DNA-binding transcriptional ArsR family regulator
LIALQSVQSIRVDRPLAQGLDRHGGLVYLTNKLFNYMVYNNMTALPADRLSATFAALADPTRRAILARLALGETSVSKLAAPFAMTMPAVSKHLKVLERAGLITRSRDAQTRPCKIEAIALKAADDWLEEYRRLWEQRLDRLDDYLKALQAKPGPQTRERKRGRKK